MEVTPAFLLAMWGAGIAGASAVVVSWEVVGSGFTRLAAIVVAAVAGGSLAAGGGASSLVALGAALVALFPFSRALIPVGLLSGAAALLAATADTDSPLLPVVTGAVFLGVVTTEMMLGHWYLVDPQLPRWALQSLAVAAGAGLVAEAWYLVGDGALSWAQGDAVIGWALIALTVLSGLLIVGVGLALRERAYTGVMAATGLSYLAVLTAFGVSVLGRALVG